MVDVFYSVLLDMEIQLLNYVRQYVHSLQFKHLVII